VTQPTDPTLAALLNALSLSIPDPSHRRDQLTRAALAVIARWREMRGTPTDQPVATETNPFPHIRRLSEVTSQPVPVGAEERVSEPWRYVEAETPPRGTPAPCEECSAPWLPEVGYIVHESDCVTGGAR
jgi:hypothetical protein